MSVKQIFSKRLKELREERGLSQTQLADNVGISRGSISFYERQDRVADIEILHKLALFFGTNADYLIGDSEIKSNEFEVKVEHLGLAESAIRSLIALKPMREENEIASRRTLKLISDIISNESFYALIDYMLNYVDKGAMEAFANEYFGNVVNLKTFSTAEALNSILLEKCMYKILDNIRGRDDNGQHNETHQ